MVLRRKGYGAWIESNGRALEEHNVKMTSDDAISCHVFSEEGAHFSLHFDDDVDSNPFGRTLDIFMDGRLTNAVDGGPREKIVCRGVGWREFRFTAMTTADDPVEDPEKIEIGLIEIHLRRFRWKCDAGLRLDVNPGPVHKDSIMAGMHRISLEPDTSSLRQDETVDDDPFVRYRFYYFPRDTPSTIHRFDTEDSASESFIDANVEENAPGPSVNAKVEETGDVGLKRPRGDDVINNSSEEDAPPKAPKQPKRRAPPRKAKRGKPSKR